MNRFRIILFPLALYIWIMTTLTFMHYSKESYKTLQKERLDAAVNYAADAAVDELVNSTADLNLDYAAYLRVSAEPSMALDMFCTTFLKNYNMATSEENMAQVKSRYLPAFAVAAYDGYYLAQPTKFNTSGAHDAIFSIKYPYMAEKNNITYGVNLGLENAVAYNGNRIYTEYNLPMTKDEQLMTINHKVTNAFMNTVYEQQEGALNGYFYLPWTFSNILRTNPIKNVTVLAYISNFDVGIGNTKIDAYAIGGARVMREQFVACYVVNGEKLYAYTDRVPAGINAELILKNPEAAARKGYRLDLAHIDKP